MAYWKGMGLRSFAEFWPHYVSQHRNPVNRALHFLGTSLALAALALGVLWSPLCLLVLPLAGYGPAWIGHFVFERNKPATFQHPMWSLLGDLRMYGLMWAGRMADEVARCGSPA